MSTQPWIAEQLMKARGEETRRAVGNRSRTDRWPGPENRLRTRIDLTVTGTPARSPDRLHRSATRRLGQALIRVGVRLAGPDRAAGLIPVSHGSKVAGN